MRPAVVWGPGLAQGVSRGRGAQRKSPASPLPGRGARRPCNRKVSSGNIASCHRENKTNDSPDINPDTGKKKKKPQNKTQPQKNPKQTKKLELFFWAVITENGMKSEVSKSWECDHPCCCVVRMVPGQVASRASQLCCTQFWGWGSPQHGPGPEDSL